MSWQKDHPELIPALIAGASALAAGLTKAAKWLVFRLVEFPQKELKAELVVERLETAKWQEKCERLENELRETSKELWRWHKTSAALAQKRERESGHSSNPPPSS